MAGYDPVMRLAVLVPSRERPHNIARLWAAMKQTCVADTSLIVGLDEDDPTGPAYPGVGTISTGHVNEDYPRYVMRAGMRQVVAWINYLSDLTFASHDALGHIGDDNVPRTHGWDAQIIDALTKTPFAFGNDLYPRAPGSLCCHIFMRSEVVDALGYMGPPELRHMFVDPVWWQWGQAVGITYLHDTILEHCHYTNGKAPSDAVYQASTALIQGADLPAFRSYCRDGRLVGDILKLAELYGKLGDWTEAHIERFNKELFIP